MSEIIEEWKVKIFSENEKVLVALKQFSCFLDDVIVDHKELLVEIEKLSITYKRLAQQVKKDSSVYESNDIESHKHERSDSDETYFSQASDETFFSQADSEDNNRQCDSPLRKKIVLNSFDIIPGREDTRPEYPYKEGPLRKKSEKDKLPGWTCRECEEYYTYLPEEERKERHNLCSKHRGIFNPEVSTPESFWNPVFSDEDDSFTDIILRKINNDK